MSGESEPDSETEGGAATLQLDLPAAHSAARMARHLIRPFARSGGVQGTELDNLLLVAAELLANAVDHGGGGAALEAGNDLRDQEGPRMQLSLSVEGGAWRLEVTDEGGGDADAVRALLRPTEFPDLEDERGRGFFLIAQMVDDIRVEPSPTGRGLILSVVRGLPD